MKSSIISPQEYHKIIHQWNQTQVSYPDKKTVCQLFKEQAKKNPNHPALFFEGKTVSYSELHQKSNQLARHLRSRYQEISGKEMEANTLIALFVDNSLEMVIGMLGILKAGAAYLPIELSYPQQRIDFMLEDSGAELLLAQGASSMSEHTIQLSADKIIYIGLEESL